MVKNLPVNATDAGDVWVQSLGQEDPLRRKWQPTPVFLPGKSQEERSLVGYSLRDHKESNRAEHTHARNIVTTLSCRKINLVAVFRWLLS